MSKQQMSVIRGSEYADFLRCRKRWNWRWNEGLKSKQLNDKLFTGTLIHKFLEVLYDKWDALKAENAMKTFYEKTDTEGQDQLQLQEIWSLARNVCEHYVRTWLEIDQDHTTIATELEFMVVLDHETGVVFTGTIDYVYKDADGHIWFMDHKTTSSIDKYEKNSTMDRQISRYWWALQQISLGVGRVMNKETGNWEVFQPLLGKDIYGFQYNVILKDVPKKPELLKKGGLSKAKNQKTTFELYMEAINEHELNLADYNDILTHLQLQGNRYFKRVDVYRTESELHAAIYEFYYTAEDMAGLSNGLFLVKDPANAAMFEATNHDPRNKLYRNITSDCQWDCEFKSLCQAEIEGVNTAFLLASSYEKEVK